MSTSAECHVAENDTSRDRDSTGTKPTATERDFAQAREAVFARLQARRGEIQEALLTRVLAISGRPEDVEPEYAEGLKSAVCDTLDHYLEGADDGFDDSRQVPPEILAQARKAARHRVRLETVLRRCLAGQTLLTDFLIEETESSFPDPDFLRSLLKARATTTEQMVSAVAEEHARESTRQHSSADQRESQVKRLLAGEPVDTSRLGYRFAGNHVAAVAWGPGAAGAIRRIASPFENQLQIVDGSSHVVWAWFGSERAIDVSELCDCCESTPRTTIAFGEPNRGLAGWRLTHRQARAAMSIGQRIGESPVRYANVALVASMLRDDLLCSSLRSLYLVPLSLVPLSRSRDGGAVARETLRAFFEAKRNTSSAAAILGVNRRTVTNRLHTIEDRLNLSLDERSAEIEAALKLDYLDRANGPQTSQGEKFGSGERRDLADDAPPSR